MLYIVIYFITCNYMYFITYTYVYFNTINESSHIFTISKVPAEIFHWFCVCFVSITNNCMLNLLSVLKYECMSLLSFTPDHALCLRGKHLMVLGVHS